jgi:hypothetical protein
MAMWLVLQSDKGRSSIRLAEAVGVSQATACQDVLIERAAGPQMEELTARAG